MDFMVEPETCPGSRRRQEVARNIPFARKMPEVSLQPRVFPTGIEQNRASHFKQPELFPAQRVTIDQPMIMGNISPGRGSHSCKCAPA
jgi:hypothetical protein